MRKTSAAQPGIQSPNKEAKEPETHIIKEEDEATIQLRKSVSDRPTVNLLLDRQLSLSHFDDRRPLPQVQEETVAVPQPMDNGIAVLDKGGFDKWIVAMDKLLVENGHLSFAFPSHEPSIFARDCSGTQLRASRYTKPTAAAEIIKRYVREEMLACVVPERQKDANLLLEDLQFLSRIVDVSAGLRG